MNVKKIGKKMLTFVFVSVVIYLGIALVLIFVIPPGKPDQKTLRFDELFIDYESLPELKSYRARDGEHLYFRHYPSASKKILILIHGSGWHSRYLMPLAEHLSAKGFARVFTPDMRGHGPTPARRGDVDYMDQLVDDLADLIHHVRKKHPEDMMILGGHSSGGGLTIRFAGSKYSNLSDAYLLLAPYLKYDAPTIRDNSGGWACPYVPRIVGLSMLNNIGVHWLDYLPVIEFNMPQAARDGTETLVYSHRLNTAYAPGNYEKELAAMGQPSLVVVGTADEASVPEKFEPVVTTHTRASVELLPGVTHMGLVVGPEIRPVVGDWLETLRP